MGDLEIESPADVACVQLLHRREVTTAISQALSGLDHTIDLQSRRGGQSLPSAKSNGLKEEGSKNLKWGGITSFFPPTPDHPLL